MSLAFNRKMFSDWEYYTILCHPPLEAPAAQGGQVREMRPQAERLSGQSIDQEEYDHFRYQYEQYKERLDDDGDGPNSPNWVSDMELQQRGE